MQDIARIRSEFPNVDIDFVDPWRQYIGLKYGGSSVYKIKYNSDWPVCEINGIKISLPGYGNVARFSYTHRDDDESLQVSIMGPPFHRDRKLWITIVDTEETVIPMVYNSRENALVGMISLHYKDIKKMIPEFTKEQMLEILDRDEVIILAPDPEDDFSKIYFMLQRVTFKGVGLIPETSDPIV